ncbi:MAG: matrixin family metalloprotease [Nitrosopumilus sp.]|nr:matrixin family metalloprotease [Nitrosopumilus sp.]
MVAGKTVNYFDNYGFIRKSIITISEEAYNYEFSPAQIEQVTKHEIGHTLGLGHANFNGNLMTERVDTGSGMISSCEIEAVETANSWKLKENGQIIHYPKEEYVNCEE